MASTRVGWHPAVPHRGAGSPIAILLLLAVPVLVLVLVLSAAGCGSSEGPANPEVRVVLITVDTLRYDAVAQMPFLLARVENAARFTRFYASTSTTQPSHASMFTGLQPWSHGVTRNGHVLGEEFSTVAERFLQAGFGTRAVVSAFPVAGRFGFAQGFDHYQEEFTEGFFGVVRWSGEDVPKLKFYSLADRVTQLAIRAIDSAEDARQFFWFHYFDPHSPYGSSQGSELNARAIRDAVAEGERTVAKLLAEARSLYAADLEFLDREIERLFARLDEEEIETHVMLVADHGESFGEQGSISHGFRLIDSQIRIPAFIWSSSVAPGERPEVAGSVDVMETLLSLGLPGRAAESVISSSHAALAGGRDLAKTHSSGRRAFGMRQTFKAGADAKEQRLNGELVPLDGLLFYAVESDGVIRRGNGEGLTDAGAPELVALFRSFEEELRGRQAPAIPPEVDRALEQLGYLQ